MERFKRTLLEIMAFVILSAVAAEPLDTWHWRSPTPTSNRLRGVAWGGDRYVAVGEFGSVVFSLDGRNWETEPSPTVFDLFSVAYGNGLFVAVGELGEILSAVDGVTWEQRASGTFVNLNAVTFGGGKWVAVGNSGAIVTSANGRDWLVVNYGGQTWRDVVWGNGKFLAVGGDPFSPFIFGASGTDAAASSLDGIVWRSLDPPPDAYGVHHWLRSAGFGQGRFFVSSADNSLFLSTDLVRWGAVTLEAQGGFSKIAYGNGQFIGLPGTLSTSYWGPYISSNGAFWELQHIERIFQTFTGVAFGPQGVVLVGGVFRGTLSSIAHSTNLRDWSSRSLEAIS